MKNIRNKVQLIGNLGRDPEIRELENGNTLAKFSLATSEIYKDSQGNKVKDTQWHNIVIWGSLAKIAENYLKKGNEIAVEGKLVHRTYEDKSGSKRFITEVVVNDLVMLRKAQ